MRFFGQIICRDNTVTFLLFRPCHRYNLWFRAGNNWSQTTSLTFMFSKPTIALRTIIFALIGSIYWIDWSPWRERNPPVSTDQLYSQNMLYFCMYWWEWDTKVNARDLRNVHVYMIHRTECTIHRLHGINTDILYGLFCFETIPRINSIPDRIYLRHSPHTFPAIKRGILPISTPNLGHFLFVYWTIRQPADIASGPRQDPLTVALTSQDARAEDDVSYAA